MAEAAQDCHARTRLLLGAALAAKLGLGVLFAILWLGGVITYVAGKAPPSSAWWTPPAFLVTAALLAFALSSTPFRKAMVVAGLVGWVAEAFGTRTGFPFGRYVYGSGLGPAILGAPVAIAAAWAVVGAYGASVAAMLVPERARPVVAAVWMTLLDAVIDPVASAALGFWRWPGGGSYYGVPLTNFAGWLAVGLIVSLSFQRQEECRAALRVGFATLAFFTIISLAHGLAGAGLVGIALCSAHLAMVLGLQRSAQ